MSVFNNSQFIEYQSPSPQLHLQENYFLSNNNNFLMKNFSIMFKLFMDRMGRGREMEWNVKVFFYYYFNY